jgi:hypothetical protein
MMISACQSPFKLPPRLARQRRVLEAKRMDSFREIHDALKKKANDEVALIKELLKKEEVVEGDE